MNGARPRDVGEGLTPWSYMPTACAMKRNSPPIEVVTYQRRL